MRISPRLKTLLRAAERFWKSAPACATTYPRAVVDLAIFHKLHFHMSPEAAWKCYSQLKSEFVDWNEVRVSLIREIQEHLGASSDSLELAVFIKNFLETVHRECRRVSLEPLVEATLTDVRRFLRRFQGLEPATVELILLRTKEHPVVPLTPEMERALAAAGVLQSGQTRDRKSKRLFEMAGPEGALALHHYLLYHTHARTRNGAAGDELPPPLALATRSRRRSEAGSRLARSRRTSGNGSRGVRSRARAARASGSPSRLVRKPMASKRVRKTKPAKKR